MFDNEAHHTHDLSVNLGRGAPEIHWPEMQLCVRVPNREVVSHGSRASAGVATEDGSPC